MRPAMSPVYHEVYLDTGGLAKKAYDQYERDFPDVIQKYTPYQKARTLEDFGYHFQYLRESLAVDDAAIFVDYVQWAQVLLTSIPLPADCLPSSLRVLNAVIYCELPPDLRERAGAIIRAGIESLAGFDTRIPSFIDTANPFGAVAQEYLEALLKADREKARTLIMRTGPDGIPVRDLYLHVFMPVLRETGRLWQTRKISVAQEHYVTGATQMFIALLYPAMLSVSRRGKRRGKTVVAACVSGELHEVGIRMVADFFEMDGWDTYFIGANTPSQSFVATVKDQRADLVAISSTMSFHLPMVHELVMALRSDPETSKTRIVVGGYPFNIMPDLWKRVGADAYAGSADEAVAAG